MSNKAAQHLREKADGYRSSAKYNITSAEELEKEAAELRANAAFFVDRAKEFDEAADQIDPHPPEVAVAA